MQHENFNPRSQIKPFIIIGAILFIALIGATIFVSSKKNDAPDNSETAVTPEADPAAEAEPKEITIPEDSPYYPKTDDEIITSDNIEEYAETIISGSELEYMLSTMDDTYAYLLSCESINRMETLVAGDYVTTACVNIGGAYAARITEDSVTGGRHNEIFINIGHTLDGVTSVLWNSDEKAYFSSGTLRLADVAKIIYDPETNQRYKDVYIRMFVPWDYRAAFKEDDEFFIRKLYSTQDGSLLGYVFEQTSIIFVGEDAGTSGGIDTGAPSGTDSEREE